MRLMISAGPLLCLATAMAQAPDNTKVNKRDDAKGAVTSEAQSHVPADVELTRRIRREITQDKVLSTYAKNIKIISRDGEVMLRGPVKSDEEKQRIEAIANKAAGHGKVNNQLEIAAGK